MRLTAFVGWGSLLATVILVACGTGDREDGPGLTLTPDGGTAAKGDGSSSSNSNNNNNVDPGISSGNPDGGVQGGGKVPDQCAADTQEAQQVPVDLYLMVDTSGSMDEQTQAGTKKWDDVKTALSSFVDDPASQGLGVALQFFPIIKGGVPDSCNADSDCGAQGGSCWYRRACQSAVPTLKYCATDADCGNVAGDCADLGQCVGLSSGLCLNKNNCGVLSTCVTGMAGYCKDRDSCTSTEYGTAKVPFGTLPGQANAVKGELNAHTVGGFTPTAPALQGAIDAAKARITANPTHHVAVVLATDGLPTECATTDIASIANIAQAGTTSGVNTYVIGVFTQDEEQDAKTNLNQIAAKGGSNQAFVINTTQNVSQQFLQALDAIRGSALPCDFTLPVPKQGSPDYSKVNVQYTSGSGSPTTIYFVPNAAACDPSTGGWYYDVDPSKGTPTKVMMCPQTCSGYKADTKAKIEIVQGCSTIVK